MTLPLLDRSPLPRLVAWFARAWGHPTARRGALSLFDQALVSGTSFATTILVGRACGKETLGTYVLAMSLLMFLKGVQDQLISAPYVIYSGRKSADEAPAFAGSVFLHQLAWLGVTLGALIVAGSWGTWFPAGWPAGVPALLLVLAATAPLFLLRDYVRSLSFAHLRLGTAITVDCAVAALQLGLATTFFFLGALDALLALSFVGCACGVTTAVYFLRRPRKYAFHARGAWQDWRDNWSFGRWALASHLMATSMALVMPWILTLTHDARETGTLGASNTITGFANLFVIGLSNLFCPLAAQAYNRGGRGELGRALRTSGLTFLATLGPLTLAMGLTGDLAPRLLFGDDFAGSGLITTLLMGGLLINAIGIVGGNGLWALERPQANFAADATGITVSALGTVLLVATYGGVGGAVALLLGNAAAASVRWWTLRRLLQETPRHPQAEAA